MATSSHGSCNNNCRKDREQNALVLVFPMSFQELLRCVSLGANFQRTLERTFGVKLVHLVPDKTSNLRKMLSQLHTQNSRHRQPIDGVRHRDAGAFGKVGRFSPHLASSARYMHSFE